MAHKTYYKTSLRHKKIQGSLYKRSFTYSTDLCLRVRTKRTSPIVDFKDELRKVKDRRYENVLGDSRGNTVFISTISKNHLKYTSKTPVTGDDKRCMNNRLDYQDLSQGTREFSKVVPTSEDNELDVSDLLRKTVFR